MVILGANLGHRLHPLQHYEYKGKNKIKIGLDIVMDYIKVVCKQIYIEMFVSRTKWQMQSGVKSGANALYCTISNDSSPRDFFHFSDKSPKTAKIETKLLPVSAKIGCDA